MMYLDLQRYAVFTSPHREEVGAERRVRRLISSTPLVAPPHPTPLPAGERERPSFVAA